MTRKYWTAAEIEALKRGEIPEGRSKRASQLKRLQLGIVLPRKQKPWTAAEIGLLRQGVVPEGRTKGTAYKAARRNGFSFARRRPPNRGYKYWTTSELDLLRRHVVPGGRTKDQCRQAAVRYGIRLGRGLWTEEGPTDAPFLRLWASLLKRLSDNPAFRGIVSEMRGMEREALRALGVHPPKGTEK